MQAPGNVRSMEGQCMQPYNCNLEVKMCTFEMTYNWNLETKMYSFEIIDTVDQVLGFNLAKLGLLFCIFL